MTENKGTHPELMGWLYKWTNYLKGYQKRWFVLSNGLLSYYRNQLEMRHTCRGSVSLHNAIISTTDPCSFIISNGSNQTFHIRAANEKERQTWLTALTLAKSFKVIESEEDEDYTDSTESSGKAELLDMIKQLSTKMDELQACSDVIPKHWSALHRSLTELEGSALDSVNVKEVNERATLFRITSSAMVNKCLEFNEFAQSQGKKWKKMLQHERDQRQRLEEMVEQLARQHSNLELAAKAQGHQIPGNNLSGSEEDDENEFYDATSHVDDSFKHEFVMNLSSYHHRRTESGMSQASQGEASGSSSEAEDLTQKSYRNLHTTADNVPSTLRAEESAQRGKTLNRTPSSKAPSITSLTRGALPDESKREFNNSSNSQTSLSHASDSRASENPLSLSTSGGKLRRTRVPDKPDYPLNLWSIMKNCIGKELSKIPMPVNFSEPLSMLQRLTEDYEYAHILDKAAMCSDTCEQMAYVAAFTVSSYSTTAVRNAKPFNPLLGETYECDRLDDLGWRSISEQVSHHPPMFAQFCEGRQWKAWQEFTMASKFRGKYLQVIPLGISHLTFDNTENHYTWRKVTTTVHNIIVGKLWVDQHGDMDITNHSNGDVCHLKFIPYSYFSKDSQRKVKGWVRNKSGDAKWVVNGTWDKKIEIAPVITSSGSADNPTFKTGPYVVVWEANPPNPGSEKFYNFSELACQLNEPEPGVAPTDSRLRPDQRLMEEGRWDEANQQKIRLEEKQRAVRRQKEAVAEEVAKRGEVVPSHEPVWFRKEKDTVTGGMLHVYGGQYWPSKQRQDWSKCPDIF